MKSKAQYFLIIINILRVCHILFNTAGYDSVGICALVFVIRCTFVYYLSFYFVELQKVVGEQMLFFSQYYLINWILMLKNRRSSIWMG